MNGDWIKSKEKAALYSSLRASVLHANLCALLALRPSVQQAYNCIKLFRLTTLGRPTSW